MKISQEKIEELLRRDAQQAAVIAERCKPSAEELKSFLADYRSARTAEEDKSNVAVETVPQRAEKIVSPENRAETQEVATDSGRRCKILPFPFGKTWMPVALAASIVALLATFSTLRDANSWIMAEATAMRGGTNALPAFLEQAEWEVRPDFKRGSLRLRLADGTVLRGLLAPNEAGTAGRQDYALEELRGQTKDGVALTGEGTLELYSPEFTGETIPKSPKAGLVTGARLTMGLSSGTNNFPTIVLDLKKN